MSESPWHEDFTIKDLADMVPVGQTRRMRVLGTLYDVTNSGVYPWPDDDQNSGAHLRTEGE